MFNNDDGPIIIMEIVIIGKDNKVKYLLWNLEQRNPTNGDEKAQNKAPIAK
jgi:hypothetical protein